MGRTACTEPQCLYKDALYLYLQFATDVTGTSGQYSTKIHTYGKTSKRMRTELFWAIKQRVAVIPY